MGSTDSQEAHRIDKEPGGAESGQGPKPGSSRGSVWTSPQGLCQCPVAAIAACLKLGVLRQFTFVVLELCRSEVENPGVGTAMFLLEFPGEKSDLCLFQLPGAAHIPWLMAP